MHGQEPQGIPCTPAWEVLEGFCWDRLGGSFTEEGAEEPSYVMPPTVVRRAHGRVRQWAACIFERVAGWALEAALSPEVSSMRLQLVLHLPVLLLRTPTAQERGRGRSSRSVSAIIVERCQMFARGEWSGIVGAAVSSCRPGRHSPPERQQEEAPELVDTRPARAIQAFHHGSTRRALHALCATPLAAGTAQTVERLRERHPPSERPLPPWIQEYVPLGEDVFSDPSEASVRETLQTAPRGSAGGPTGGTLDLLSDMVLEYPQALRQLCRLMGVMLRGELPALVAASLGRSRLVALLKGETEEEGVRPIAMGEALHRLTSRWLTHQHLTEMRQALAPLQLGVGVSDGAATVVRGIRGVMDAHPTWSLLSLDVANAFNSVERVAMYEGLRARGFQRFIPFLRQFYSTPSDLLYFGVQCPAVLQSARGVRQGDPMGPFLYCIAYQDVLEAGAAVVRQEQGHITSYLDDSPLVGPLPTLGRAYAAMRDTASARGCSSALRRASCTECPRGWMCQRACRGFR